MFLKPLTHPVQISVDENEEMGCFECCVVAGNFDNEEDAHKYADAVADFLREAGNGDMGRIQ